jgi:hypothetical protein
MWEPPPAVPTTTNQQRRQKIGLIIFVVIFFLITTKDDSDETKNKSVTTPASHSTPAFKLQNYLQSQLEDARNMYPYNLTGYFSGTWAFKSNLTHFDEEDIGAVIGVPATLKTSFTSKTSTTTTTPNTNTNTASTTKQTDQNIAIKEKKTKISQHIFHDFNSNNGTFLFRITKSAISMKTSSVIEVQGSLRYIDGFDVDDWSLNSWSASAHGLYFPGTGRLTMFTNSWNYNLYLRKHHRPGISGNIQLKNDTLINNAFNGNGKSIINQTIKGGKLNVNEKNQMLLPCITRIDMSVSFGKRKHHHISPIPAATTLGVVQLTSDASTYKGDSSSSLHSNDLLYDGIVTSPLNCPFQHGNSANFSPTTIPYLLVKAEGQYINFERLYVVGKWYGMFACLISIIQLATHIQLLKASQNPLVAQSM